MSTPAADGFRMPAEWTAHERTWMAWPGPNPTFDDPSGPGASRAAWAAVARAVRRFEPVTVVCGPGRSAEAGALLGPGIDIVERELDDAWMRDIGPTFLTDGNGRLAAVDWTFNGWGLRTGPAGSTTRRSAHSCRTWRARTYASQLVNEGGAIHVDGEGTVLLTETVQLGAERNPHWTKERVEAEIHAHLGTRKAIWLPRGLTADYPPYGYGTLGHVDIVAAFARPGVVVAHHQPDPAHPDHDVTKEVIGILKSATDARGRRLEVVEVAAPTILEVDGHWADYSYINHYLCNGGVVLCGFDDPRDGIAAGVFRRLFPRRTVTLVDARAIFAAGGGIHCITQQQPSTLLG
ncbi:agmatine deiminase family protein [Streptomyces sp. T1317-0309]|nr:agmatine deiminase family protein [Streptomyces sp. T1317-0309]